MHKKEGGKGLQVYLKKIEIYVNKTCMHGIDFYKGGATTEQAISCIADHIIVSATLRD